MNAASILHVNRLYFHDLDVHGEKVLFHIPSSALFKMDEVSSALLEYFKRVDKTNLVGLSEELKDTFDIADIEKSVESFLELSILSDKPLSEGPKRIPEVKEFPLSTVVLNVNTGCNLSCTYCYKEDLDIPSEGKKMNFETARKSIEMLLKEAVSRDKINVVFFGGEPLSNMALIRPIIGYTEKRCEQEGKQVEFSLTTNATLLTDKIVDYLDEHRVGISISMDGPESAHDRRRITVGGKGTYAVVAEKSRRLIERYKSRPIGARVTLTAGYTDVVEIHDHLKNDIGFFEVGVAPVTSGPVSGYDLNSDELNDMFESMKVLGRHYRDEALKGNDIGFSNLSQLMTDLHEGRKKSLPCGAGVGLLAVDHDGDLNLCHRFTGSDLPTFGNVDKGIDKKNLGTFLTDASDLSGKECAECRIRNLCAGGCYHESYSHFGDPLSPTYHYCDLMRDWVDFGLEIYFEIIQKNPSFFERNANLQRNAI